MSFSLISEIIHPRQLILNDTKQIILLSLNVFDIKQKDTWIICFIIWHQHQTRSRKIKGNKTQQISVKTQIIFLKTEPQLKF